MSAQANKSLIGAECSETVQVESILMKWDICHKPVGMCCEIVMSRPIIK